MIVFLVQQPAGIIFMFDIHTVFPRFSMLAGAVITSPVKCEERKIDFIESGLSRFSLVSN